MIKLISFISLFITSLAFAAPHQILLSLGESKNLPMKGKSSVWIQDRAILKAEVVGGSLSIKGLQEGLTSVRAGDELYQVQVLHPAKRESFVGLKSSLNTFIGLTPEIADGDLLVTGRLYRMADWIKLANLMRKNGSAYQMRAAMSQSLQNESQKHFSDLLYQARLAPQTVIFSPAPEVRVAGTDMQIKKYQKLLQPFGIAVLKDENSLDIAPTVKVQITVAEIKHRASTQYGIGWPGSYSAKVLSAGGTELGDAAFTAMAIEDRGWGKVLASPNIICRSGKEAEFLAGGEIPIKIMNYKIQDIVWKRYGILLRVKPKADSSGRISLSIDTEVSTIDAATGADGIPGILTNRVSSHFDLTRPQTIALSGLLKDQDSKNSSGLPFLSRLPILGALFASKDFREDRSELVIFVRPSIMKEGDEDNSNAHLGDVTRNF